MNQRDGGRPVRCAFTEKSSELCSTVTCSGESQEARVSRPGADLVVFGTAPLFGIQQQIQLRSLRIRQWVAGVSQRCPQLTYPLFPRRPSLHHLVLFISGCADQRHEIRLRSAAAQQLDELLSILLGETQLFADRGTEQGPRTAMPDLPSWSLARLNPGIEPLLQAAPRAPAVALPYRVLRAPAGTDSQ